MNINLNHEERNLLCEMIDRRLTELRVEIHRTDSLAYRAELEKDLPVLESLQERLSAALVA